MSGHGTHPVVLSRAFFEPFDRTYDDVTREMHVVANGYAFHDKAWLLRLIDSFADERAKWNKRPELDEYRRRWLRLNTRFLRLVAGAYLHIGYDLPRAIADDWPGHGRWASGPSVLRGMQIYAEIRHVFPKTLQRVSRDRAVIGWLFLILAPLSGPMLAPLGNWMLRLREAAWTHADILATQPNRALRERAMAEAMCAALEDVSDFYPWTSALLEPPYQILSAPSWTSILALILTFGGNFLLAAAGAAFALYFVRRELKNFLKSAEAGAFAEQFARQLLAYLEAAVRNPEGFQAYLSEARRASGLGDRGGSRTSPSG